MSLTLVFLLATTIGVSAAFQAVVVTFVAAPNIREMCVAGNHVGCATALTALTICSVAYIVVVWMFVSKALAYVEAQSVDV